MNRVLEYIEQKRLEVIEIPFLRFVQDGSIDPWERLSFAPCVAPMTMGFSDFMTYGLRDASSKDALQLALNDHTRVDDQHWKLFLQDLQTMGLDEPLPLTSALQLLWGEHSAKARLLIYRLFAMVRDASPILRLATLEAFEVGAAEAFMRFREAGRQISEQLGKPLYYFGQSHQDQEDEHEAMEAQSIRALLSSYAWTQDEEERAKKLVNEVFACYAAMGDALHKYALKAREFGRLWPVRPLPVKHQ